ncbi:MAG: DUF1659 domain-containing protein [Bacillota bacterium]|nr:DUF1659 domain-containing protein [Bacillota bacterium]
MSKSSKIQSTMILTYKEGVDVNGKDIIKNARFAKVKVTALDDDVLAVGAALGKIMEYPVINVVRADNSVIVSE